MKSSSHRIERLLVRLLARQRGSAQAIRDVTYVKEILRFALVFGFFVLLPMLALSLLALRSIGTEEAAMDDGLEARAGAIASQVHNELDQIFEGFERRFQQQVTAGDIGLERLYASDPALQGTFRFDADGDLTFPYAAADAQDRWPEPSEAWDRATLDGRRAEEAGRHRDAIAAYRRATAVARAPQHRAASRFAIARCLMKAGDPGADAALVALQDDLSSERDEHGFRITDLAAVLRAEAMISDQPANAADKLRSFVEARLAEPWILGVSGEPFLIRRALADLQGLADERWLARATAELDGRLTRFYWANVVSGELAVIADHALPDRAFHYEPEARALWATVAWDDQTWAFSFDYEALRAQLQSTVVETANRVDTDLRVSLVPVDDPVSDVLVQRSLAPQLPWLTVVVQPADPEDLADQRRWTRWQRRLVIALSIFAGALGLLAVAGMVNRELDTARLKSDFAANVSHELRSPITQIRLKAEMLQLGLTTDDADRQAHYDAIVHEADRLSRLVDNVLDFASIERGVKRYLRRASDLGDVLRKAFDAVASTAGASGFEMVWDVPDDLPVVWIDTDAIGQVATNLLSNALKYGSDGKWVRLEARAGADHVTFAVSDHGIGIPPSDLDRVFEHFYRVESTDVRARRGTGIGLTIVRYIVEAHGGTIQVDSTLGVGSTFTVTLPTAPPADSGG